ncbi:MAG TPA: FAD-dependent oxidoreductase [Pirellulales bacterium]
MSRHVVIVGGGVIGLCTAWYAVRRGLRVTVVERGGPQRDGCSFGNAGLIVPSHFVPLAAPGMISLGLRMLGNPESPFYVKPRLSWDLLRWGYRFWRAATADRVRRSAPLLRDLHLASLASYEELAEQCGHEFGLQREGLLMLCKTQQALEHEAQTAHMARELGLAAEILDAAQTAARDPGTRYDIVGSVYYPRDAHLAPDRLMRALQTRLEAQGVCFAWHAEAKAWQTSAVSSGQRRVVWVEAGGQRLEADEFVLCAGSWSPATAQGLGLTLLVQAGKGYSLTLQQPRALPRLGAVCVEARLAVTPMMGRLRCGGTLELSGRNQTIDPRRVRGIVRAVPRYYPDFREEDFVGVEPWCGLRPCSPDGLPYLGRTARYSNLIVATGHAMLGISLGPITGRLVAQLLCHERPAIDLALLSPDRHGANDSRPLSAAARSSGAEA